MRAHPKPRLWLAMTIVTAMLLTACARPTTPSSQQPASGTQQPAQPAPSQPASDPNHDMDAWLAELKQLYSGSTITISAASHPSTTAFQQMIPEFEQATGITVRWDVVNEEQIGQKQTLEFQSKSGRFDVLMRSVEGNPRGASLGMYLPLDDFIQNKTPAWFDYEDIMPAYRDLFYFEDKQWAIPFAGETVFLIYRKDLFEQHGKQVPKTWDELYETAQYFQGRDGLSGVSLRTKRGWEFTYTWSVFIFPFGGRIVDPVNMTAALSDPGTRASLEYLIKLKSVAPPGVENYSFPEAWDAFMQGKTAMAVEASAAAPEVEDPAKSQVAGRVGYAPLPAGPAGGFSGVWGWGYAVSAHSKNPEAAWAAIVWLSSKAKQNQYVEVGGTVSRKSGLLDPAEQQKYPYYQGILAALDQAGELSKKGLSVVVKTPKWWDISDILGEYGALAFVGQMPVDQAINQMQSEVEKVLAE